MTSGRALGQCPLFSLAGRLESTGRLIRMGENRRPRTYWRGSTARERPAVSSTPSRRSATGRWSRSITARQPTPRLTRATGRSDPTLERKLCWASFRSRGDGAIPDFPRALRELHEVLRRGRVEAGLFRSTGGKLGLAHCVQNSGSVKVHCVVRTADKTLGD
jgi:hypothetical protein